jgi:hypothetical protein
LQETKITSRRFETKIWQFLDFVLPNFSAHCVTLSSLVNPLGIELNREALKRFGI